MAVVDSETRVHGIEGLRVVDSSIFPTIPNGNLNGPTIMLAERAADIIKGKGMLESSNVVVGLGNDWENVQR
ncbi:MAG: choline dehydrogenase [Gammaproteobacteria bacterium]|jgi:choline dehydrogenase